MINQSLKQGESPKSGPGTRARIAIALGGMAALTPATVAAISRHGVAGVFASIVASRASLQIYLDLVIVCLLASVWLWFDSRKAGRAFWPWFLLTMAAGSYGPLLYLLAGALREKRTRG